MKPAWRVGLLSFVTLGAYAVYWSERTWQDLKVVIEDNGMSPIGHAAAGLVPGYGLSRLSAHFHAIETILERDGLNCRIRFLQMELAAVVAWLLILPTNLLLIGSLLAAGVNGAASTAIPYSAALLLIATIVAYGQANLNRHWTFTGEAQRGGRTEMAESIVLVVFGGWLAVIAFASAVAILLSLR